MTSHVLLWLVAAPAVSAVAAPLLAELFAPKTTARGVSFLLAHLACLGLVGFAVLRTPGGTTISLGSNVGGASFLLIFDRPAGLELAGAAIFVGLISLFSQGFIRAARYVEAFRTLLLVEQAGVSLAILAGGLASLYVGLLVLSVSLALMVGLDFAAAGRSAALRLLATLEVTSAVAFAAILAFTGGQSSLAFADLRQSPPGGDPASLILVAPVGIALLARAGLWPLHRWIVDAGRAAATPVAAAVTGVALPLGALVLAHLLSSVLPADSGWPVLFSVLGTGTALVGGLGMFREKSPLGWISYAAVSQIGFAITGFAIGTPKGALAGWLGLTGACLAILVAALSLGVAARVGQQSRLLGLSQVPLGTVGSAVLGIGLLALAPLPPFPTFSARLALFASLIERRAPSDLLLLIGLALATVLAAASVWRAVFGLEAAPRPAHPPRNAQRLDWETVVPPTILSGLLLALGILPAPWLAKLIGATSASVSAPADFAAAVLLLAAILAGLGGAQQAPRLVEQLRPSKRQFRPLAQLSARLRLDCATDPYLILGGALLLLGRLSALVLDQTLGRLVRTN